MQHTNQRISDLIKKFLFKKTTPEEDGELMHWKKLDRRNNDLLESFRDAEKISEDMDFLKRLHTDTAWQQLQLRTKKRTSKKILFALTAAAAAILCFVLTAIWFYTQSKKVDTQIIADVTGRHVNDIRAGKEQALLILADGQEIDLMDSNATAIDQQGSSIRKEGNSINYSDAQHTKLVYNTLVVPKAGTYKIALSDGTKVWVNANTTFKFPVNFVGNERRVFIDGEAYFEVAKDAKKPFVVDFNGKMVEVIGTHFNVNTYSNQLKATLLEGAVNLHSNQQSVRIYPGQMGVISNHSIDVSKVDTAKIAAWKENEFYFKSDQLEEIMPQISRWYDIEVIYDKNYKLSTKSSLTGYVSRQANLTEVLEMLSFVSRYSFRIEGRKVYVKEKIY